MKKLFSIIICITAIMAMSSCCLFEDEKPQINQQETAKTIEGLSQEFKKKIAAQDTLMNALVSKVDVLAEALSQAQQENAKLKTQVDDLKSPKSTWAYVSMGAFVLGLIALIMSIIRSKGTKKERIYKIFEKCIEDSQRIKDLQVNVKNLMSTQRNTRSTQSNTTYALKIDSRLRQLESQMSQIMQFNQNIATPQPTTQSCSDMSKSHKEAKFQKIGYAKNDKDRYFTTIYDSNQEGCVFKITFISPEKGKFNLISLDKIQSRNDWQQKVECSGISIKEASDFIVEDEGICEKIDANTWQVNQPLKIQLLK
jgi:hypothetical protein